MCTPISLNGVLIEFTSSREFEIRSAVLFQQLCDYRNVGYAGDNYTRKRVTVYIALVNGSVIAWRSQSQKIVTPSVTESEYPEIAEVCREIIFVCKI